MEGGILVLENQEVDTLLAEDALNFDFNKDSDNQHPVPTTVPFQHRLANPLRFQDIFIIEGRILKHGLRFSINFNYGFNNIAFHLNPRLDQNYIARNSYVNGEWGEEDGYAFMKNPLKSGKLFQIQIFVARDSYMVCINGFHMFTFAHRIPPQNVEKIEIFGDIDLSFTSLTNSELYPIQTLIKYKKDYGSLDIPFTHMLEEELKPGTKIVVKGKIKLLPVSFRINLQSSDLVFPHPVVIHHLNVRYYTPESYVVQNSWGFTGEHWDEEIRSCLPLPLSPGKDFEIHILFYDSYIVVEGESWSLPIFKLRWSLDDVVCVYIQGDIQLNCFKITPFSNKQNERALSLR